MADPVCTCPLGSRVPSITCRAHTPNPPRYRKRADGCYEIVPAVASIEALALEAERAEAKR